MNTTNYRESAESDAKSAVSNFRDEIVEMLIDDGKASDDLLNDYPNGDGYHHESHTDRFYNLQEAAAVLDKLYDNEETDRGLWEGQDMKTALGTCAAFTYANAVYSEWNDLIGKVNDEADDILSDFNAEETDLETERDDLLSNAQDEDEAADFAEADAKETTTKKAAKPLLRKAAEHRTTAEAARTCAAEKQALLDSLETRKADALRAMVDSFC